MIYSQPGITFQAVLDSAPANKVGEMGVRLIRDSDGATVIARTIEGITEVLAGSGIYLAKLVAPGTAGNYTVIWDDGSIGPTSTTTEEMVVSATSPVATLPNPGDLCTLAEVKALLKIGSRTDQDTILQILITRASKAVCRWTDREFAPITLKQTRTFEWDWEGELCSLAPYDVQQMTGTVGTRSVKVPAIYEVAVDSDHAPTEPYVLSTEEWRAWPQPPRDGTYLSIRLRPFAAVLGRVVWANRQVLVTADWGFPEIPSDVAAAATFTVKHWLTVNAAALPRPDDDPNLMGVPKRGIPLEAKELLEHYKRAVAF